MIIIYNGLQADLPTSAPVGQLLVTTDTHQLYVGTGSSIASLTGAFLSFADMVSGENFTAEMVVGEGATLAPDPSVPGVISANYLWNTPVASVPPEDGQILVYNASLDEWIPSDGFSGADFTFDDGNNGGPESFNLGGPELGAFVVTVDGVPLV
jgi:hypothetical protein